MATMMAVLGRWVCLVVCCVVVLAGCVSGSSDSALESADAEATDADSTDADSTDAESTDTEPTDTEPTDAEPTDAEPSNSASPEEETATSTSIDPLNPADDPPPTTAGSPSTSAWISRVSMTADSIEVRWSARDGGDEYSIHRLLRSSDAEPALEAMTDGNRIHLAGDLGSFTDEGVEPDTSYWYGVRIASGDGDVIAHGWHPADAVDDEEPPSAVPELTAVEEGEAGEVLVSWSKPDENHRLHGYRIFRGVDGETPEQVGITWQIEQTSFVDDEVPDSGQVVYEVVAFDFHWNDSLPAQVTVDQS